jgi:hypothetical protein
MRRSGRSLGAKSRDSHQQVPKVFGLSPTEFKSRFSALGVALIVAGVHSRVPRPNWPDQAPGPVDSSETAREDQRAMEWADGLGCSAASHHSRSLPFQPSFLYVSVHSVWLEGLIAGHGSNVTGRQVFSLHPSLLFPACAVDEIARATPAIRRNQAFIAFHPQFRTIGYWLRRTMALFHPRRKFS